LTAVSTQEATPSLPRCQWTSILIAPVAAAQRMRSRAEANNRSGADKES
jgi:hypothetical protein